jgi:hypothetical protein
MHMLQVSLHNTCGRGEFLRSVTPKVLAVPFFSRSSMIAMLPLMELGKLIPARFDDGFKFEVSKW